ncbi:MAG: hypothetical protein AAFR81_19955 [Chloroflexota bacterium]
MEDFGSLLQTELSLLSRRLRGMAMISRGIVPNLVISQRVVDHVVQAAQGYLEDETGESMVGIIVDTDEPETMPTLYVFDTISPDQTAERRSHMFEQGDIFQTDLFNWQLDNWNAYLRNGKDLSGNPIKEEWKVPLKHLGDWHKQPGSMIQPSGGDLMTALRFMDDEENQFEFLLVPIVTLGHASVTSEEGAQVNYFTVPMENGTSLRMDWWFIHRDVRVFQPITPTIVDYDELPQMPKYPWHILDIDLMDEELALIEEDGMFMLAQTAIPFQLDDELPLEIGFMVGRAGSSDVFIVATAWDYPNTKPRIFKAPFTGIDMSMYVFDVFDALWAQAEPIPPPADFEWNPESSYIVDYLATIEKELGSRPEGLMMPWERQAEPNGAVNIAVEVEGDETVAPIAEANGTDASESDADESTPAEVTEASNEEETT